MSLFPDIMHEKPGTTHPRGHGFWHRDGGQAIHSFKTEYGNDFRLENSEENWKSIAEGRKKYWELAKESGAVSRKYYQFDGGDYEGQPDDKLGFASTLLRYCNEHEPEFTDEKEREKVSSACGGKVPNVFLIESYDERADTFGIVLFHDLYGAKHSQSFCFLHPLYHQHFTWSSNKHYKFSIIVDKAARSQPKQPSYGGGLGVQNTE